LPEEASGDLPGYIMIGRVAQADEIVPDRRQIVRQPGIGEGRDQDRRVGQDRLAIPVGIYGPELSIAIPIDGAFHEAAMVHRIRIGDPGM
jgi:hypothetical protein